jgi:SAM-dependent methyltransferase
MPFSTPDFRHRAQLEELMDQPCSREQLRACLIDLGKTNRCVLAYRPTLAWLNSIADSRAPSAEPLRILDVASGYGDTLRKIEQWARRRGIAVELTGLDLNPDTAVIAAEASPAGSGIRWVSSDIFAYTPPSQPDLVISSLFTHHLGNDDIVRFLRWMEQHAAVGWFINDLSRAPIPYYAFRVFAKLMRFHPFVQHDGPISVARAFVPEEWRDLCAGAGLAESDYQIKSYTPARLCVARRKI